MTELDPEGVRHELEFWRGFVQSERFQKWTAPYPTPELDRCVYRSLRALCAAECVRSILDVGSGPVSILHGSLPPTVTLTTADPLGDDYAELVDFPALGLQPPYAFAAEDLPFSAVFDVVHVSNALDHVVSPLEALQRMVGCIRPGGFLVVQGHVDEADHEGRAGFHQHNLSLQAEKLVVDGALISPEYIGLEHVWSYQALNTAGRQWYVWFLHKCLS